jgi:hypothetical protein
MAWSLEEKVVVEEGLLEDQSVAMLMLQKTG